MVPGDPAAHVQPLGCPAGRRAVLPVQQHQLLLSSDRTALQHSLELKDQEEEMRRAPIQTHVLHEFTYLSKSGLLLTQPNDDDAVRLADAALGPGGEVGVRLVQDDAMDVLLLAEPAGQTVLMDADEHTQKNCQK